MMAELTEVVGILQGVGADPHSLSVSDSRSGDPTITIHFSTASDLRRFTDADGRPTVKTYKQMQSYGRIRRDSHIEYHALYDRPGRQMLVQHFCFSHCPDREGGDPE